MAALSSSSTLLEDSSSRNHAYSRKQKSLGLLCSNFLSLYDREGVQLIGLDDAASRLARKAKNQYCWKGFEAIPVALQELKEEGLKENFCAIDGNDYAKILGDEDETFSIPATGNNKREKSLALLTQNFVKLFICSKADLISLDEAAKLLLGDDYDSSIMRTKIRRLYDIGNVLSSMNLIEKTHASVTRKPAFRWLGWRKEATCSKPFQESRKRTFGVDVTNINFKKNKTATSAKETLQENFSISKSSNQNDFISDVDGHGSDKKCTRGLKSYHFGPFAPVTVAKIGPINCQVKENHDWASFASAYRPHYQNQALKEIFSHYMEAWRSWFSEAVKKPIKIA